MLFLSRKEIVNILLDMSLMRWDFTKVMFGLVVENEI